MDILRFLDELRERIYESLEIFQKKIYPEGDSFVFSIQYILSKNTELDKARVLRHCPYIFSHFNFGVIGFEWSGEYEVVKKLKVVVRHFVTQDEITFYIHFTPHARDMAKELEGGN